LRGKGITTYLLTFVVSFMPAIAIWLGHNNIREPYTPEKVATSPSGKSSCELIPCIAFKSDGSAHVWGEGFSR